MSKDFEYIDLMMERAKRCVSIKSELDSVKSEIHGLKHQIELDNLCKKMIDSGMSDKEVSRRMRDAFIRAKRGY